MAERRQTKREATQQRVAERRAAEAAERARAARRRRNVIGGAVAAVVLVVAIVVVFAVQSGRTSTAANAAVPAHTLPGGTAVEVTAADVTGTAGAASSSSAAGPAPVVVNLYEDLQCPNCKAFEAQSGSTLAGLLASGKVVLDYHPMAFLDSSANGNFSTRALNAAAVVLDTAGPGAFQKFHDLIYANQTPEEGPGMSNAQLISYADQAGATGPAVTQAIDSEKFRDWTRKVTDQASEDGVTGTPTVIIGGTKVADLSPAGVTAAVTAAAAK